MNPGLRAFTHATFGQIRTIEDAGRIMLCGRDAATASGYQNPADALAKHREGSRNATPLIPVVACSKRASSPKVTCTG